MLVWKPQVLILILRSYISNWLLGTGVVETGSTSRKRWMDPEVTLMGGHIQQTLKTVNIGAMFPATLDSSVFPNVL